LAHQPMSPESRWPEGYVRFGNILDLVPGTTTCHRPGR
jgi:hypothetical protein